MKYLFLLAFCIINAQIWASDQTTYKLYCLYTPQFETLYKEYFLPSIQDDFEIIAKEYPQECPLGSFRSEGWDRTMLRKLELLLPALKEILKCLGNHDFVVQQSWPRNTLCAGFFVMRGNEKTRKLIQQAYVLLDSGLCIDDQLAIQASLQSFAVDEISWAFLPTEQFPNGRYVLHADSLAKRNVYTKRAPLFLEDTMILFHANCTIGLQNKYHFLSRVQEAYRRVIAIQGN